MPGWLKQGNWLWMRVAAMPNMPYLENTKGSINNYLSAAGYDMKKEGEDWAKRIQAAKELKQNSN